MTWTKEKQKEYMKGYQRKYRQENKEQIREYNKKYYEKNKKKVSKRNKKWKEKNKDKIREHGKKYRQGLDFKKERNFRLKNKYNKDKNFNIKGRLRCLFRSALRYYTKTGKIVSASKYGVDYKIIMEYLKPFPKDISKYHVDHIKPLCSFDLTDPKEIKIAFAPENHQWLLIEENLSKGGKY